ncbi:MAG: metalloregulator ArsR/SmtB family transcription factor [Planctomycetota bacterium]
MVTTEQISQRDVTGALKLLADGTRLRILGLVEREELSVGELSRSLGLAQSRVSNHLRLLREAEVLSERHVGTSTYLRLVALEGGSLVRRLYEQLCHELEQLPEHAADLARLDFVLAERRDRDAEFFDSVAGRWDTIAGDFENGQARQRALAQLLPTGITVADLGCGTGYMTRALLGVVDRIVCVDRSEAMLDQARARLEGRGDGASLDFRRGEFESLPLDDGEVDGVVASMVLHHLPVLDSALREMRRVLRPGGRAVILELMPHREGWVREALGDRHLGLDPGDVLAALRRAGFEDVSLDPSEDRYRPVGPDGEPVSLALYLIRARA